MDTRELLRKAAVDSFLELAPVDWEEKISSLSPSQRDAIRIEMEHISLHTAELAGYLDERYGHGCGDQGHKSAAKRANRNGKTLWMKFFGYNAYHPLGI